MPKPYECSSERIKVKKNSPGFYILNLRKARQGDCWDRERALGACVVGWDPGVRIFLDLM
jgi:hypothetical protein